MLKQANKVELYFKVSGGKMSFDTQNWQTIIAELARDHEGESGRALFELVSKKTIQQLRYFHGPLLKMFLDTVGLPGTAGDKEWMKKHLKRQFVSVKRSAEDLAKIAQFKRGEITEDDEWIDPSLADFSKAEMIEFITNCLNYMGEWGLSMNEQQHEEFKEVTAA